MAERNSYLDQVVAQQQVLESNLRSKRSMESAVPTAAAPGAPPSPPAPARRGRTRGAIGGVVAGGGGGGGLPGGGPADSGSGGVGVRITGFGRWKTVLVPPNAFVVHTRRGRPEPLHIGLGMSFRFNPATDTFLVVPGAMQTILINAFCICRELQGVLVQAYVQWIIQDFATAYRKLDFSDAEDPMRLVNLQLREQAEAAIKDKVATMTMVEILSDKQPIIEELTARLRAVAEGEGGSDTGLGLRIVTVQIKEAVVSSARLWENLQQPYRAEQSRLARLAGLSADEAISEREMAVAREREGRQIATERELSELRATSSAAEFDRKAAERVRRAEREQADARVLADLEHETARSRAQLEHDAARSRAELEHQAVQHALHLERERSTEEAQMAQVRLALEQELQRLALTSELALAAQRAESAHTTELLAVERELLRAAMANDQSPANLQARLIEALPRIMAEMPKPDELRTVHLGGVDQSTLPGLVTQVAAVISALRSALPPPTPPDR